MNQTVGNVTAVTIAAKSGKSPGAISNIRYAGSATIPQTAGTYTVTFDVAAASGWNAATGLSAGSLTVNPANSVNQTPVAGDYTFAKLGQTAGSVTAVSITAKSGKSPGAISNIRYAGSSAIPQAAGTYAVTFDVAAAAGWNAATSLSAGNLTVNPANVGGGKETGLYLGIIGFNEDVTRREIGLLNTDNKAQFTAFINGLSQKSATGLYYAVDTAVNMLRAVTLPDKLVNVSIVTFTDGLDNASIAINPKYASREAYRNAVKDSLSTTRIRNLNISAYAIGLRGSDVVNEPAYRADLAAIASHQNNVKDVTNMDEVKEKFKEIAEKLYKESQVHSIRLKLTGGYDDGNKIRFTFDDNVEDADDSNFYIEGIFRRSGTTRLLQYVVYQGLTSSSGTTVTGSLSGVYVYFTFEITTALGGGNVSMNNAQQWQYIESETRWQRNSEFSGEDNTETIVEKNSALIMLVLDCTDSLGNDFNVMKNAATDSFINVLLGGG